MMCFRGGSPSSKHQLESWRELCDAAMPGPWGYSIHGEEPMGVWLRIFADDDRQVLTSCGTGEWTCVRGRLEDAQFIKEARRALPALLDDVERYQRLVEDLEVDNTLLRHELGELKLAARCVVSGTIVVKPRVQSSDELVPPRLAVGRNR